MRGRSCARHRHYDTVRNCVIFGDRLARVDRQVWINWRKILRQTAGTAASPLLGASTSSLNAAAVLEHSDRVSLSHSNFEKISTMTADVFSLDDVLAIAKSHPFYVSQIQYPPNRKAVRVILQEAAAKQPKQELCHFQLTTKKELCDRPQDHFPTMCC